MAKRIFAAGALLLILSVCSAQSVADESGCTALARWVKSRVAAAASDLRLIEPVSRTGQRGRVGVTVSPLGARHVCASTAEVASRAFSEALTGLDVKLDWNDGWIQPGDYCLSHRLEECYPSQDRLSPLPPPRDFAFVQKTWQGVTRALASQMPYGSEGDLTSFSDDSLADALSAELATTLRSASSRAVRPRETAIDERRSRH